MCPVNPVITFQGSSVCSQVTMWIGINAHSFIHSHLHVFENYLILTLPSVKCGFAGLKIMNHTQIAVRTMPQHIPVSKRVISKLKIIQEVIYFHLRNLQWSRIILSLLSLSDAVTNGSEILRRAFRWRWPRKLEYNYFFIKLLRQHVCIQDQIILETVLRTVLTKVR